MFGMCDTFVALPSATAGKSVIFAKSADCEVNEANALVRIPGKKHLPGEAVRVTHLVIPQTQETYEVILTKAFWTYGCEIGINEFGLAMGEEAVYTREAGQEDRDGIIGPDLMRLALERARNCREAIEVMTTLLEQFGQGGSAELKGNSHFDSSFLLSDTREAYILETAGRQWAVKQIDSVGSISNLLLIGSDWDDSSLKSTNPKINWLRTYAQPEIPPTLGAPERQSITFNRLTSARGRFDVKMAFDLMRHHSQDYHPATAEAHRNICVHAGPQENRWWQADGAMVTDVGPDGMIAWVTGTSGTCVSIFKPVFLGLDLPDIGPTPTEHFDPKSLWWKHELLHRRAMADFDHLVPEIRQRFDTLEDGFLAEAPAIKTGTAEEKREFSDYCFREAMKATDEWIHKLRTRRDLTYADPTYCAMWQRLNAEAGLAGLPT
jgi:secernin